MAASRLLTLPSELQTHIYSLVLIADSSIIINDTYGPSTSHSQEVPSLSLLSTCHSIREIAKPIFFHLNNFVFEIYENDIYEGELEHWMEKFSPVLIELGQRIEIRAYIDNPSRHGTVNPSRHAKECYFATQLDGSRGSVSIYVDFETREVDARLTLVCRGEEQKQYAHVVEWLEGFFEDLESGRRVL